VWTTYIVAAIDIRKLYPIFHFYAITIFSSFNNAPYSKIKGGSLLMATGSISIITISYYHLYHYSHHV